MERTWESLWGEYCENKLLGIETVIVIYKSATWHSNTGGPHVWLGQFEEDCLGFDKTQNSYAEGIRFFTTLEAAKASLGWK